MAIRTEEILIDDLDGSTVDVSTCHVTVAGVEYRIDLSAANRQRLHDELAPFIAAARRLPTPGTGTPSRPAAMKTHTARVRRWWSDNQATHQLPRWRANGPIPRTVYAAFNAN